MAYSGGDLRRHSSDAKFRGYCPSVLHGIAAAIFVDASCKQSIGGPLLSLEIRELTSVVESSYAVHFELFAPTVEWVELVGSWLDKPERLRRDDKGLWTIDLHVPDGEHTYKFRLPSKSHFCEGSIVEVSDPFARRIDKQKDEATVVVVENGKDVTTSYEWLHDDQPLPANHELLIYELHVGEFAWDQDGPGTFKKLVAKLDYLRDLGVRAVELMPITSFPNADSWGYDIKHPCAVEPSYGTPADLKELIDECHARGMRVIVDLVLNHMQVDAPMTQIDFHYWFRDPHEGEETFGAKLDYEKRDEVLGIFPARKHGIEVALWWIQEYHIDGFRLDATRSIANYDFLYELRAAVKEAASMKPFFLIAEHLPEDPTVAGESAPTDGAWRISFLTKVNESMIDPKSHFDELVESLDPSKDGYTSPSWVVNYIESHDDAKLMRRLGDAGIFDEHAKRRCKLAAGLLYTAVGVPMLYMGQEFGGNRPVQQEIEPLEWHLLDEDYGHDLAEYYRRLGSILASREALGTNDIAILQADSENLTLAFERGSGKERLLVLANFSDEPKTIATSMQAGRLSSLTSDEVLEVGDQSQEFALGPSEVKIFARS